MLKQYDGLFIFGATAKDETLERSLDRARAEIVRLEGQVEDTEVIGKRTFARPQQKQDSGVYARIRFRLAAEKVSSLLERYHLVDDIFRVQILAVDLRTEAKLAAQAARQAAHAEQAAAGESR